MVSQRTASDDPQFALCLTQQEWDDLAVICRVYRFNGPGWKDEESVRRRDLCKRIEEAA